MALNNNNQLLCSQICNLGLSRVCSSLFCAASAWEVRTKLEDSLPRWLTPLGSKLVRASGQEFSWGSRPVASITSMPPLRSRSSKRERGTPPNWTHPPYCLGQVPTPHPQLPPSDLGREPRVVSRGRKSGGEAHRLWDLVGSLPVPSALGISSRERAR